MSDPRFAIQDILGAPDSRMHVNGDAPVESRPGWLRRAAGLAAVASVALGAMSTPSVAQADLINLESFRVPLTRLAETDLPLAEQAGQLLGAYAASAGQLVSSGLMSEDTLANTMILIDPACKDGTSPSFGTSTRAIRNLVDNRRYNVTIGTPYAETRMSASEYSPQMEVSANFIYSVTREGSCTSAIPLVGDLSGFVPYVAVVRLGRENIQTFSPEDRELFDTFKIAHEIIHVIEPYHLLEADSDHPFAKAVAQQRAKIGRMDLVLSGGVRVPLRDDAYFEQALATNAQRLAGIFGARSEQEANAEREAEGAYLVGLAQEMVADVGGLVMLQREIGRDAAIEFAGKLAAARDAEVGESVSLQQRETGSAFAHEEHSTAQAVRAYIAEAGRDGFAGLNGPQLIEKIRSVAARGWMQEVRTNLHDNDSAMLQSAALASRADLSERYVEGLSKPTPGAGMLLQSFFIRPPTSPDIQQEASVKPTSPGLGF